MVSALEEFLNYKSVIVFLINCKLDCYVEYVYRTEFSSIMLMVTVVWARPILFLINSCYSLAAVAH